MWRAGERREGRRLRSLTHPGGEHERSAGRVRAYAAEEMRRCAAKGCGQQQRRYDTLSTHYPREEEAGEEREREMDRAGGVERLRAAAAIHTEGETANSSTRPLSSAPSKVRLSSTAKGEEDWRRLSRWLSLRTEREFALVAAEQQSLSGHWTAALHGQQQQSSALTSHHPRSPSSSHLIHLLSNRAFPISHAPSLPACKEGSSSM